MVLIPTDEEIAASHESRSDVFYAVPEQVQAWMEQAKKLVPQGYTVRPWTMNRAVTVFNSRGEVHQIYTYEAIEDGQPFILSTGDYQ